MEEKKTIEDLLRDESFLNWVNQSNDVDVAKWNAWCRDNAERNALLGQGKAMVLGLSFNLTEIPAQKVNESWDRLASKINEVPQIQSRPPFLAKRRWLTVLLVLLGLFGIWGIKQWVDTKPPALPLVYETGKDLTKVIKLPDGTTVTLNTNSSIKIFDDYLNQDDRVVKLNGEAYFKVASQPTGKTFRVETKDVEVNVIGTAFNLNSKRPNTIVSLTEGIVLLKRGADAELNLVEGQSAYYDPRLQAFKVEKGQSTYWRSWKEGIWSFGSGVPLSEVLLRIEETYGMTYVVNDVAMLSRKASGDVSVENREILFEALSVLLDVDFTIDGDQLIVSSLK